MRSYIKKCMHGDFMLLHGDMISEYVNLYGEWSEPEVTLYSRLLIPNSNVVEIGANIGMHTVPLAKICNKGKILCFEPQRIIFQILNANLSLNNLLNVNAQRLAIGADNGSLEIQCSDYDTPWNYGSFSIERGFSSEGDFVGALETETVNVVALDDIEEVKKLENLDLLKIDVEGAEAEVLNGAHLTISRLKPLIFIENNNEHTSNRLIEIFLKLDYVPYWFISNRYRNNNFNQARNLMGGHDINMICVARDHRSLPPDLKLVRATHFDQIRTGLPIYV